MRSIIIISICSFLVATTSGLNGEPEATSTTANAVTTGTLSLNLTYKFYSPIKDGKSGESIGGLFQDNIYTYNNTSDDQEAELIGTTQGYFFDLPRIDNGTRNGCDNVILFLKDGELNILNHAIVSAEGSMYQRFQGGYVREKIIAWDPVFQSIWTLYEPEEKNPIETSSTTTNETIMLRTVGSGDDHYYFGITENITGKEELIGEKFMSPVYLWDDENATQQIGIHEGFGFNFPSLDESIKYGRNFNHRFLMNDGSLIDALNDVIVRATGKYQKYTGTLLTDTVITMSHPYVSKVVFSTNAGGSGGTNKSSDDTDFEAKGNATDDGDYDFKITSKGGLYVPIIDPDSGEQIGERFQNPVLDPSGNRIGTNQGYGFNFPPDPDSFTRHAGQSNRIFYLNGGTLNVFNDVIVHATGIYEPYTGGRFQATIVSQIPDFISEIVLVLPATTSSDNKVEETNPSIDDPPEEDEDRPATTDGDSDPAEDDSSVGRIRIDGIVSIAMVLLFGTRLFW